MLLLTTPSIKKTIQTIVEAVEFVHYWQAAETSIQYHDKTVLVRGWYCY